MLGLAISDFADLTWENRLPVSSFVPKALDFLTPCMSLKQKGDVCMWGRGTQSLPKTNPGPRTTEEQSMGLLRNGQVLVSKQ